MRTSIAITVTVLILVFGLYFVLGISCKPAKTTVKKTQKTEVIQPPKPSKESLSLIASRKGKTYLLSVYNNENLKGKSHGFEFDAFWGPKSKNIGFSAFACAALMAKPEPIKPSDEKKLADTIEFLLNHQDSKKGSWSSAPMGQPVYETSVVVLALISAVQLDEKYAKDKRVINAIRKGVDYILTQQYSKEGNDFLAMHSGGFSYGFSRPNKAPANMSTTHFALDAIYNAKPYLDKAGKQKVDDSLKKALKFLENCQNREEKTFTMPKGGNPTAKEKVKVKYGTDGGGIYSPGIAKAGYVKLADGTLIPRSYGSMTYVLLKGYIFAGLSKNDPRVKAAFDWIKKAENFTFTKNPGFEDEKKSQQGYFYYIYTASKTLDVMGVDEIEDSKGEKHNWRSEIEKALVGLQKSDGSWANPEPRWSENLPVLATAYAVLALGHISK